MEINKILSADILDILFEGKNKLYGAYDLRKSYDKRMRTAMAITMAIFLLLIVGSIIARNIKRTDKNNGIVIKDLLLEKVKPEEKIKLPPPAKIPPPLVKTIRVTTPVIVKDPDVTKPPPDIDDIKDAKVDVKTTEGKVDDGIAPPVDNPGSKVIETPASKIQEEDKPFLKVEVEAMFQGGDAAWNKYVTKAITNHIEELTEAGESGTVRIRFIVDRDGNVSEVEALNMKSSKLAEIAIATIRKGPKWTPAQQNGRIVKAYREQPVTFTIQEP